VLTLALALALAAPPGPALGLPPWPLSPDGELVAAPPGVPLECRGGEAEPVAPGLWRILPAEGAAEVALRAGALEARAAVEPPPGRVIVAWDPPAPVKGRDREVTLALEVRTAAGDLDEGAPAPRLTTSAGRADAPEPAGPGRFRARLELPETRFPEVVALFALVPRCPRCATPRALGAARLPLPAAIVLPGRVDPGVAITVEVGGALFGPVRADAAGRFAVPVVVPPGAARAQARSVSAIGNEKRKPIDLGLPPVPRLACVASPSRLPADGRSRAALACTAFAPDGAPAAGARVELRAGRGAVEGARWDGALLRAAYVAPRGGAGPVEVVATWKEAGGAGRATVALELVAGPPAAIDWEVAGEPLRPGEAAPAAATARDARGDRLGEAAALGAARSRLAAGRFTAGSELGDGQERVVLAFALPPSRQAASLALRRAGQGWVAEARDLDGRPAEGVALAFGGGARAATDARGEARAPGAGPSEWVTGPGGLRAAGWSWAPPPEEPFELSREVTVALRPPEAVDVAATLDGRTLRWSIRAPAGAASGARRVLLRSQGVRLGPIEPEREGGRCAVLGGSGPVAVVDEQTGAAAVVVVP
jgi:hypothetical protein